MTDGQRQKLLNWLTSMLLLAMLAAFNLLAALYFGPSFEEEIAEGNTLFIVIPAALTLPAYMYGFFIVSFWHALDAAQIGLRDSGITKAISRYSVFVLVVMATGLLTVFMTSEQSLIPACTGNEFRFDGCDPRQPDWISIPFDTLLLFLLILCMGKAVVSIRSRLKKA